MASPQGIEGLKKVVEVLRDRAAKIKTEGQASVVVGYTQNYAIYVHENMTAKHPIGQAKFLEGPARRLSPEIKAIILGELKNGRTIAQALLKAGLYLQRESQKIVPIDTGALKNSAFTRLEAHPPAATVKSNGPPPNQSNTVQHTGSS